MGVGQVETIVSKMKELEVNKTLLQNRIGELDKKIKATLITQEMVELYLEQHRQHIENKDMDACKKFISSYVEQVIVYKDGIEVIVLLDMMVEAGHMSINTQIFIIILSVYGTQLQDRRRNRSALT
ncbi:hypothetical protein JCM39194_17320 [Desulfotomaculum varum]